MVSALISAGASVHQAEENGATPLYIAAEEGHDSVVSALISAGASVDQAAENGATPLYIAAQKGHDGVVNALISSGASVDQAEEDGVTPLIIAVRPLTVMSAPIRASSGTCIKRFSKMVSVMDEVPSAMLSNVISCACMSVGKPGCGWVVTVTGLS